MRWLIALLLSLLACLPVAARTVLAGDVLAGDPQNVSVTIYRDPYRDEGAMQLSDLGGFAVVSEIRRVTIPAGRHRLRFVGVVDGIIPASSVISGLPNGVIEKNQDAALLSPSSLIRASRGKAITLVRTDPATGKPVKAPAEVVSASEDGVVFRTAEGNQALRCSGFPETFRYDLAADGLQAQPTLSVMVDLPQAISTKVTLTYIATGFDWNASYTAHLSADGSSFDLGGWITLANGNSVSLENAQVQLVAGKLSRERVDEVLGNQPQVIANCWPMQTTSDIPERAGPEYRLVQPYLEPRYPRGYGNDDKGAALVVTATRRSEPLQEAPIAVTAMSAEAVQEQLGDLKLYRIPRRTTVAAMQMKQTRLFDRPAIPFERVFTASIYPMPSSQYSPQQTTPVEAMLRGRNDKQHGLGMPLPAGAFAIDQMQFGRPMLLSTPDLHDTATDEKIELGLGEVPDITVVQRGTERNGKALGVEVTISNAGSMPVPFELELEIGDEERIENSDFPVILRDGKRLMVLTIPANSSLMVHFDKRYPD